VVDLTNTIVLPETVYNDLITVQEEMASLTRKPFSAGMTVSLLIAVYRAHMSEPCARDAFRQRLSNAEFMSPEDFEKVWDSPPSKAKSTNLRGHESPRA
jgi:hypothetical protein